MNEWYRDMPFQPKSGMRHASAEGLMLYASDDIRDFRPIWPVSSEKSAARRHAFQNADFLETWCATIGAARQTEFVFVGVFDERGQPVMLLPLGIEVRSGLRILTCLDGGVVDYNGPVLFPASQDLTPAAVAALWGAVRRLLPPVDLMLLEKMPDEIDGFRNPLLVSGATRYPHSGYVTTIARLDRTGGKFDGRASNGQSGGSQSGGSRSGSGKSGSGKSGNKSGHLHLPFAQDSRRNLRRLGEMGKLSFLQARTTAERERFLETMIRQKTRRYIETRGIDSFDRPGYRAFFRQATERFAECGLLHLSAVLLDDKILAAHWGYVAGSRFYYLMPSYEGGEWPRYSPGRLLLHWLLDWAAENGLTVFDQGIGDEAYKQRYCDRVVALWQIETAFTLKGRGYLALRRARGRVEGGPLWTGIRLVVRAGRRLRRRAI
jgi:CelD/BcsL family acetyltransferase involved in cellulose biosynthesis